ncbi:Ig-like domain-containing protein [Leptospira meyeri]|uniref:Ig-like domain-containing protein n=1 Tax=Leptospira meyeri TaxID=29508 RepID=UPI000C295CF9|nr:Ig-like domain-containing protein [Leptospira meyeri]PJZ80416.1 hypothetical protein CH359_14135 [Leptospira meyeri]PJZ95605.1 hypothetical protein CH358_17375 [Leptospira meyeri]
MKKYFKILIAGFSITGGLFVTSCELSQRQINEILIGSCIHWHLVEHIFGPRPTICNALPSAGYRPTKPAHCESCTPGYSFGYCERINQTINGGSPSYSDVWVTDDLNGPGCGKTTNIGSTTICSTSSLCVTSSGGIAPIRSVTGSLQDMETLILPPNVRSVSPSSGASIYQNTPIVVQFDKEMDASSFTFAGSLGNTVANFYEFSKNEKFNDKLVISGHGGRILGSHKILLIKGRDVDGNDIQIELRFSIQSNGGSMTPISSSCVPDCRHPWTEPYMIPFTASGGFPPYTFSIGPNSISPPPGAFFTPDGHLAGPATLNFAGLYVFEVVITDSAGASNSYPAVLNTQDLVAACFFLGICGF